MGTTTPTPSQVDEKPRSLLRRLLINRNYALLWVAMATSQFGNIVFTTAMLLWVATTLARNAPWAAFAVGSLTFLPQIVTFICGTVAGVYVDRWNKRRTLLLMDGVRTILVLLLVPTSGVLPLPFPAGSDASALFQLGILLLIVGLISICNPFVNGALVAILYDIVEEKDFPVAFGRGQLLNNIAIIVAPPLAAAIFFTVGVQWAIILNALTFAVSFGSIFFIRPAASAQVDAHEEGDAQQKTGFVAELLQGVRFVTGNSVLVAMLISTVLSTLGIGAITILGIFFVTNNLHSAPGYYPFLDVAFGIGAMAGAIIAPMLEKKIGLFRMFWLPGLATGLLVLILSRLTNFPLACVLMFLIGVSEAILSVATGPLAMSVTPQELIGRANALFGQVGTFASVTSIALAAFLIASPLHNKHLLIVGSDFGSVDTVFIAAGIMIIAGGICAMVALNHYTRTEAQGQPTQGNSHIRRTQVFISCAGLLLAVLFTTPVAFATPAYQATVQFQTVQQQAATGQQVDGLRCEPTVGSQTHLSIHLSVYINNEALALPAGIGIIAPPQPGVVAYTSHGRTNCLYPLHVYENDNIIHAELFDNRTCYLGQFFDIWGQPLNRTQIADYHATASQPLIFEIFDASGNEHIYNGDPRKIPLVEHETIVALLHSPLVHATPFIDWNGL